MPIPDVKNNLDWLMTGKSEVNKVLDGDVTRLKIADSMVQNFFISFLHLSFKTVFPAL